MQVLPLFLPKSTLLQVTIKISIFREGPIRAECKNNHSLENAEVVKTIFIVELKTFSNRALQHLAQLMRRRLSSVGKDAAVWQAESKPFRLVWWHKQQILVAISYVDLEGLYACHCCP